MRSVRKSVATIERAELSIRLFNRFSQIWMFHKNLLSMCGEAMRKLLKTLANPQGAVIDAVMGILMKKFKLDKVLNYVEEPNELDEGMKDLRKDVDKLMGSKQLKITNKQVGKEVVGMVENDRDPIKIIEKRLDMHEKDLLKVFDKMDKVEMHIKQLAYLIKKK